MAQRLAYFADFGSPHRPYTGGYRFATLLFNLLRSLPVELTVFAPTCRRIDQGKSFAPDGARLIELPALGFGLPRVGLSWTWQLGKQLQQLPRQDLYIFDQPVTPLWWLPRVPALAMFHGSDAVRWRDLSLLHPRTLLHQLCWQKPVIGKLQRRFLTKTIGVPLFNSHDTLNRLGAAFNLDVASLEQYVTCLPVDTAAFRFDPAARQRLRAQYGIAADEVVVIALSNFDQVKRPDRLRAIIVTFLERFPRQSVRFLLVGGGRQARLLDPIFSDNTCTRSCTRVGEVSATEVAAYYSAADIALSTSQRESFGYTIAEGMAVGLPFVAFRGGAIAEVIEDKKTGFVVDDLDQFVAAVKTLVDDASLRQSFSLSGKQRVESQFSLEAFRHRLQSILRNEFNLS